MSRILKKYHFFCAVAVLIGTIVGAGVFGLPFVMARLGFALGFLYLVGLTGAVILIHLAYGEIVLRTRQAHRLVGYAAKYLGRRAKIVVAFVTLVGAYGSLLAYIILGGEFLKIILSRFFSGPDTFWVLVFFVLAVLALAGGLRLISGSELILALALAGLAGFLIVKSWPLIDHRNFLTVDLSNWLLPYGVILFALGGSVAVPEMRQILAGQESRLKPAILWGTVISAVIYLCFSGAVVGVSGPATSEEAISGLVPYLGDWVVQIGAVFGLVAVFTSFVVIGLYLKNTYRKDYRLSEKLSFFLTCVVPITLYFAGVKSFILVIGFVGAVAAGLEGILMILIYIKARKHGDRQPEYSLYGAKFFGGILILVFSVGLIVSLVSFLPTK